MRFCMNRIHALSTIDKPNVSAIWTSSAPSYPTIDENGALSAWKQKDCLQLERGAGSGIVMGTRSPANARKFKRSLQMTTWCRVRFQGLATR